MTDLDFAALAREAREQVLPGEPPLDALTAPAPARSRGHWVALGAAAAVLAVIGTVLLVPRTSSGPEPVGPPPTTPGLVTPEGMRWVGSGDVVLAVPTTWADSQYGCETDPRPSVVYDTSYWQTCQDTELGRQQRPASLSVLQGQKYAAYVAGFNVSGRFKVPELGDATRSEAVRQGGDAGRYWSQVLVVPSVNTVFIAEATTRSAVVRMIASARRTPDKVAAPPATAGQDLSVARAALSQYDVRVRRVHGYYRALSVIGSDPAFGTPLAVGATITLTVSSGLGDQQAIRNRVLRRHHLVVRPAGSYPESVARTVAATRREIEARLARTPGPWDHQLVLRRVTDTENRPEFGSGPPFVDRRLAWMVLTPTSLAVPLGGRCCAQATPYAGLARAVTVYDAVTGDFLLGSSF